MLARKVKKVVHGIDLTDGAGVKLRRVISRPDAYDFDPFLMLDSFDSKNKDDYIKGFPWHPHRGIETITYLLHGNIEHADSLGNKGNIGPGGCQWMTAGRGIIHQEMPQPSDHMLGVQLWLNLPQKDKMRPPAYRDITADKVPVVEKDKAVVKVISGEYEGVSGAIQGGYTAITFLDIELAQESEWSMATDKSNTVFVFIVQGSVSFGEDTESRGEKSAVLFTDGEEMLSMRSHHNGARLFVLSGKALKEPIAWGGPIVMNTREELQKAFQEIEEGTFVNDSYNLN